MLFRRSLRNLRPDKRNFIVTGIVLLMIVPSTALVEVAGYVSVNSVVVDLVTASRTYSPETYPQRIAFDITARVLCQCLSPATHLSDPSFDLAVDSIYVATVYVGSTNVASAAIIPGSSLKYSFKFETTDFSVAETIGARASNHLALVMTTKATAWLYEKRITVSDSSIWTW